MREKYAVPAGQGPNPHDMQPATAIQGGVQMSGVQQFPVQVLILKGLPLIIYKEAAVAAGIGGVPGGHPAVEAVERPFPLSEVAADEDDDIILNRVAVVISGQDDIPAGVSFQGQIGFVWHGIQFPGVELRNAGVLPVEGDSIFDIIAGEISHCQIDVAVLPSQQIEPALARQRGGADGQAGPVENVVCGLRPVRRGEGDGVVDHDLGGVEQSGNSGYEGIGGQHNLGHRVRVHILGPGVERISINGIHHQCRHAVLAFSLGNDLVNEDWHSG